MKRCLARSVVGVAALCGAAAAQTARPADRDAAYRRMVDFASLVRGGSLEPHWMANGNSFWYADSVPDRTAMLQVDPVRNTRSPLLDVVRVRRALAAALGHEPPYSGLPFERFTFQDDERTLPAR